MIYRSELKKIPSCRSELRKEFSPWIPIEKLPSERNLSGKPRPEEILKSRRDILEFKLMLPILYPV